jgi:hypothetical protein
VAAPAAMRVTLSRRALFEQLAGVRERVRSQREDVSQFLARELGDARIGRTHTPFSLLHHSPAQCQLGELALENLLLNGADSKEAVDVDVPLLPVSPDTGHGLQIVCRVPG